MHWIMDKTYVWNIPVTGVVPLSGERSQYRYMEFKVPIYRYVEFSGANYNDITKNAVYMGIYTNFTNALTIRRLFVSHHFDDIA